MYLLIGLEAGIGSISHNWVKLQGRCPYYLEQKLGLREVECFVSTCTESKSGGKTNTQMSGLQMSALSSTACYVSVMANLAYSLWVASRKISPCGFHQWICRSRRSSQSLLWEAARRSGRFVWWLHWLSDFQEHPGLQRRENARSGRPSSSSLFDARHVDQFVHLCDLWAAHMVTPVLAWTGA